MVVLVNIPIQFPGISFLDYWEERTRDWVQRGINPRYRDFKDPTRALLIAAEEQATRLANSELAGDARATLNSMRDIEPSSPFKLLEELREDDGKS